MLPCMQAGYELFDLPQEFIDLTFGVVTILTSVVATLLGGLFIDMVGSSVRNAMAFCGFTALVSLFSVKRMCALGLLSAVNSLFRISSMVLAPQSRVVDLLGYYVMTGFECVSALADDDVESPGNVLLRLSEGLLLHGPSCLPSL